MAKKNIDKFLEEVDEPASSSSQSNIADLKRAEIVDTRNDIGNELESLLREIKAVLSMSVNERSAWGSVLAQKMKELESKQKQWQKDVAAVRQEDEERDKKRDAIIAAGRDELEQLRKEKAAFNEDKLKLIESVDSKVREVKGIIDNAGKSITVSVVLDNYTIQNLNRAAEGAARKAADDFKNKIRVDNYVALPTWVFGPILIFALGAAAALGALVYYNYGACNYSELLQAMKDTYAAAEASHISLDYMTVQIPSVEKILNWWLFGTGGAFGLWILYKICRSMSND